MITPLDIENKKFAKQRLSGYSVEEVDDFLDEITADYERMYKENNELKAKMEELKDKMEHYENIETTLNNTLVMAQKTADEVRNVAKQQADQIVKSAQEEANHSLTDIENKILLRGKELEDLKKQFDVYKAKMESLLISQLELLKEQKED